MHPTGTTTAGFEAVGNGGELYVPFVSCTPGSFPIPGTVFTIPLDFDWCSNLYFFAPAAPTFFSLAPPGQLAGVLSPSGTSQGSLTLPNLTPTGFSLDLHITFLTLTSSLQWTGLHGMGTVHVNL